VAATINELSETDGLLVKSGGGDNAPYLFLHLSFQEYLTACALAERANNEGWQAISAFVDRKSWNPAWQETVVFLSGMLDDPAPLLGLLADASKDDATRQRLCVAGRCLPELSAAAQESYRGIAPRSARFAHLLLAKRIKSNFNRIHVCQD